ncbi:MAG: peptide chain release factor N(5)-glutamine methyltransferase [Acidimicrobiia bacterium]
MTSLPPHEVRRLRSVASDDRAFDDLAARRAGGEPLQYLEGTAAFGPFDLVVDDRVLIPRPETEGLWELAAGAVTDPRLVLDLCTGSGALAIALSASYPEARVIGTDISSEALTVARENGLRHAPAVEWVLGDLFDALDAQLAGAFDLIVANPPYVASSEWARLPDDVRREPRLALVSGPTGLEVLRRIASESSAWLASGGVVVCEIGETQSDSVRDVFDGFASVEIRPDLQGRDRYVVAGT